MAKKERFKRPPKDTQFLARVRKAVSNGDYLDMVHAKERQEERDITRPEYEYVLKNGRHEKSKDEYKKEYNAWNYAIRGRTLDNRELRVIVSFEEEMTLIITVIDLEA